jgi:hypothetical protein
MPKEFIRPCKMVSGVGPSHVFYMVMFKKEPVSITERSKACTVYDRLNIGISGSNPARGMDVCLHVSVLSCVSVEALCWTDPPTKESYQMSVDREVH